MLVGHADYLVHATWDVVEYDLYSDRIVFCLGIRRECDGGTAWERVEMGDCPLTPPTQNIEVKAIPSCTSVSGPIRFPLYYAWRWSTSSNQNICIC